jgi:Ni/Fe-hydrogenase subunit HybB-like protein
VFGPKSKKPRERFYLLPGQGGRNYHQKQRRIMRWTIAVSLVFALLLATVMWWVAHPRL